MRERNKEATEWIYAYFLGYYEENKYPPTFGEVARAWNESHSLQITPGFISSHIKILIEEGKLVRRNSNVRVWTVPDDPYKVI